MTVKAIPLIALGIVAVYVGTRGTDRVLGAWSALSGGGATGGDVQDTDSGVQQVDKPIAPNKAGDGGRGYGAGGPLSYSHMTMNGYMSISQDGN